MWTDETFFFPPKFLAEDKYPWNLKLGRPRSSLEWWWDLCQSPDWKTYLHGLAEILWSSPCYQTWTGEAVTPAHWRWCFGPSTAPIQGEQHVWPPSIDKVCIVGNRLKMLEMTLIGCDKGCFSDIIFFLGAILLLAIIWCFFSPSSYKMCGILFIYIIYTFFFYNFVAFSSKVAHSFLVSGFIYNGFPL